MGMGPNEHPSYQVLYITKLTLFPRKNKETSLREERRGGTEPD